MGGYRCVSLEGTQEDTLAGELGEIWFLGVLEGELLYRAFKLTFGGDEKIFTFKSKHLARWLRALKVPSDPNMQVFWANNPNKRGLV